MPFSTPSGSFEGTGDLVNKTVFRILFVDGPNLNVLGKREPCVYGNRTLDNIHKDVSAAAALEGAEVSFFQSNHEGEIVDRLQKAKDDADGIVINPAAYTHTSVAIRDALLYCGLPTVEVHLSNLSKREEFRRISLVEDIVDGRICGIGGYGYVLALLAILHILQGEKGGAYE